MRAMIVLACLSVCGCLPKVYYNPDYTWAQVMVINGTSEPKECFLGVYGRLDQDSDWDRYSGCLDTPGGGRYYYGGGGSPVASLKRWGAVIIDVPGPDEWPLYQVNIEDRQYVNDLYEVCLMVHCGVPGELHRGNVASQCYAGFKSAQTASFVYGLENGQIVLADQDILGLIEYQIE